MTRGIRSRMAGCWGALVLAGAGSPGAASAQGALIGDSRLDRPVTLDRKTTELRRVLRQLSELGAVELSCEAEGTDRLPVALSLSRVPLRQGLEALGLLYPDLDWKRTPNGGLALFAVQSVRQVLYRNRSLSPQTAQSREMFRIGMEFVQEYRRLAGPRREVLASPSGYPVRALPLDMRELVRRMLRAKLTDTDPSRRQLIQVTEGDLPDARVQFTTRRQTNYTLYELTLRGPNGEMVMLSFNNYKPVPVPDAPARDEAKEAADRARLLERDPRFSRPVSLSVRDAPLQSALRRLCEQAGVSYVWEGGEKYPDPHPVNVHREPFKAAIRSLATSHRFEWDRSPGGILVIRKGRFDPRRLAIGEARTRFGIVADEFDQLSPEDRRRLGAGLPIEDLPDGLRGAVMRLFQATSAMGARTPSTLTGRIISIRGSRDFLGRSQYEVEASGGQGPVSSVIFSR